MEITLEKLMELRVLRPSMFDRDGTWFVIYTEDGPKDITLAELSGDVSGQQYNYLINERKQMLQLEHELYGLMEAIEAERKENQTISFDPESDEPQDPRLERIGNILTLLEVLHWEDYKRIVIDKFNVPADYFD